MHDYIVVGAGSAGCVVANRLSEDPDVRVLVLEAGGPDDAAEIHMPLAFSGLYKTSYDWDYDTHHEPYANGRRIYLPRGKTYGGSSSLNAMIYIRGHRVDYDEWDLPGWAYEDVLPYFKRSEDNGRGADEFHGTGGPLPVSEVTSGLEITQAWLDAAANAGHQLNPDFNGAEQDGFGRFQVTMRDGRRASTATTYLHPALERPNVEIEPYAQVTRVVIEDGRAVGVEIQRQGETIAFEAAREVILCGGAYNSPQLLMLSGVGPREELEAKLIPVVADSPGVGKNLSDHANTFLVFESDQACSLHDSVNEANLALLEAGQGLLTSNVGEAGAFLRTREGLDAPDVQFHFCGGMYVDEGLVPAPGHGFSISVCVLKPRSRGEVTLRAADPLAKPQIQHNYFKDPHDVETTVAGLRTLMEVARTSPLGDFVSRPYSYPADDSDEALAEHVRATTIPLYHPVGTCRMGTDDASVVDPELRVRGVEGLRVIDASVMPNEPRGNTTAPTIMIGERGADLVLGRVGAAAATAGAAV